MHTSAHARAHTHIHTHKHIHTQMHTHMHACKHTCTHTHTYTHTYMHPHMHAHTHTQVHNTPRHRNVHTQTHTDMYTQKLTHTDTHTHLPFSDNTINFCLLNHLAVPFLQSMWFWNFSLWWMAMKNIVISFTNRACPDVCCMITTVKDIKIVQILILAYPRFLTCSR